MHNMRFAYLGYPTYSKYIPKYSFTFLMSFKAVNYNEIRTPSYCKNNNITRDVRNK